MAKQTINIGTTANDGTGDPLRTAFDKVNDNFTELYSDDAGDVGSIIAGTGISVDQATGDVTISLDDNAISEIKLEAINTPSDDMVLTYDSATGGFEWRYDYTVSPDNSTIQFNGSSQLEVKDDGISYEKIDDEFSTSDALTAGATVDVDFDAAQVFTLTPNQNTTLNITNPKVGITKAVILTGAGGSYTLAFTVGGASGTFNKIAGDYDDTSSTKNFIQIICVSATEFWYSISQIAS